MAATEATSTMSLEGTHPVTGKRARVNIDLFEQVQVQPNDQVPRIDGYEPPEVLSAVDLAVYQPSAGQGSRVPIVAIYQHGQLIAKMDAGAGMSTLDSVCDIKDHRPPVDVMDAIQIQKGGEEVIHWASTIHSAGPPGDGENVRQVRRAKGAKSAE